MFVFGILLIKNGLGISHAYAGFEAYLRVGPLSIINFQSDNAKHG